MFHNFLPIASVHIHWKTVGFMWYKFIERKDKKHITTHKTNYMSYCRHKDGVNIGQGKQNILS